MNDPSADAIAAAAKVIHEAGCGYVQCTEADHPDVSDADRDLAHAALEAAMPHIAEAFTAQMQEVSRHVMTEGVEKITGEMMAAKLDVLEKDIRANEQRRIASRLISLIVGDGQ